MTRLTRRTTLAISAAAALTPLEMARATTPLYVPPEEDRHQRTFMMWPSTPLYADDPGFGRLVQKTIVELANTIAAFEPVTLLAAPEEHGRIRPQISSAVELWDIPTDDLWARDAAPLFAYRGDELVVSHIQFNGWGRKQTHRHDARVAKRVAAHLGLPLVDSGLVGEPGGAEHDGHGNLMAHESSWVIRNRNPGLNRTKIGDRLKAAYGAGNLVWSNGVKGLDITGYHIDGLARFTGPGRVLINLPRNPDPNAPYHRAALDTYDALVEAGFNVETIPEPDKRRVNSIEFVAAYVNYYVCNGAVIVSQFGDAETDAIAVDALRRHYTGREVIAMNVDALGELGGGIHCATQQMPA